MPHIPGNEILVNTYTTNIQTNPKVAYLTNGNFVITWQSDGQDGSGYGVYAQIFDSAGNKVNGEFLVNTYVTNAQSNPSITALINGNFVITWQSKEQDGSSDGIYAQMFNSAGSKVGSEFLVNTYVTSYQGNPSTTALINGNFVITWQSREQDGSSDGIYAQIFNSAGSKVGSEFLVNTYVTGYQANASITTLINGSFVITWRSSGQDGSGYGIFAQIFDFAGSKVGSEFLVNTYVTSDQAYARITALINGNFVITWQSSGQDGPGYGIYAQLFDSVGSKVGTEFRVNTYISNDQGLPDVVALTNGNFVIVWESEQDGSSYGIYGQEFTATASPVDNEFRVNTYTSGYQRVPSIATSTNGNFVITWKSALQDGSGEGIYAKLFMDPLAPVAAPVIAPPVTAPVSTPMSTPIPAPISTSNHPPIVLNPIADQTITVGEPFGFNLANNTFFDPDGDPLTFLATSANGSPLPSWITFNPALMRFEGQADNPGTTQLAVTAKDPFDQSVSSNFELLTQASQAAPTLPTGVIGGIVGGITAAAVLTGGIIGSICFFKRRKADKDSAKVVELDDIKNPHEALLLEAKGYIDLEQLEEAKQCYEKILAIDPMQPKALLGKGKVLEMQGNTAKAEEIYNLVKSSANASETDKTRAQHFIKMIQANQQTSALRV